MITDDLAAATAAPNLDSLFLSHKSQHRVQKPWGHEQWIYNGEYCGKLLFINAGSSCSFHYHKVKDEVLYIQSGQVLMLYSYGDDMTQAEQRLLMPGDAFHVPPGLRHRMFAMGLPAVIYEVSTHHEDADSIRV